MRGKLAIRINAMILSAIFTANFLVVCQCATTAAAPARPARMAGDCCCSRNARPCKEANTRPCKETNNCPGMQAVKFNLAAKEVPSSVQLAAMDAATLAPLQFHGPAAGLAVISQFWSVLPLSLHSPPDRLAFYHFYLV